jgi:ubiquitin-protein ligase E3 C
VAPAAAAGFATAPRGPLVDALLAQSSRVLTQLQTFSSRGSLAELVPAQSWLAPSDILRESKSLIDQTARAAEVSDEWEQKLGPRVERLLRCAPHSIPFAQRVTLLRAFVQGTRERANLGRPAIRLAVRRTHIFEDGLVELENANWQARFQVSFIDELGRREQGQDAGGLFKEYWEKLAETAFNPDYGLFKATEARLLYPNPQANNFHENVAKLFEFLGLVIGKAIFEGIVVEPCFAPFFIAKLLGRHNSYYDLQSLDPALFANLQRLKGYEGNVADLCCSFVATTESGEEVPLLPDGQNVTVTNENRFKYIYMLSDYKLNIEQKAASAAFLRGFQKLIDERWLWMFGEDELQQVISGAQAASIDIDDLQRHTQFSNCSSAKDKLLVDFWTALKAMTPEQRSKVLRFVTSCSRTPLLGFGHLVPPFTVHKVPIHSDKEKLPTASTCFNTLKLPTYSSWKVMKQKLEFVIEQGAGFELD